jgi:mono/diheme cytochrome c family protein
MRGTTVPTRRSALWVPVLLVAAVMALGGVVWFGVYDVGADDAHTRPVRGLLEFVRERSIAARASRLDVPPDLDDPARITQGAGNYDAMCATCHLAPGVRETELSRGLLPAPPDLTSAAVDAAAAFWVIKHGIKASGMPAWGRSMDDPHIWNMVAFLQALPGMDEARYSELVAASGGHSHGGGETARGAEAAAPATMEHRHADGTVESHPMPAAAKPADPADDGHDHVH